MYDRVLCETHDSTFTALKLTLDFERCQKTVLACVSGEEVLVFCDENYFTTEWLSQHKKEVVGLVSTQIPSAKRLRLFVDSHK